MRWFDYGSGKLDADEIRLPGLSGTWKNGETCPDGTPDQGLEGVVLVFVNGQRLDEWDGYIPQDGDRIRLKFGPAEDFVNLDDRIVFVESEVTRTIEITISSVESTTAFNPANIQVQMSETVKVILTNDSEVSHGMRIAGSDGVYGTGDDFVVIPEGSDPTTADRGDLIKPGEKGFTVIRFDEPGQLEFRDPTSSSSNTGGRFATGVNHGRVTEL